MPNTVIKKSYAKLCCRNLPFPGLSISSFTFGVRWLLPTAFTLLLLRSWRMAERDMGHPSDFFHQCHKYMKWTKLLCHTLAVYWLVFFVLAEPWSRQLGGQGEEMSSVTRFTFLEQHTGFLTTTTDFPCSSQCPKLFFSQAEQICHGYCMPMSVLRGEWFLSVKTVRFCVRFSSTFSLKLFLCPFHAEWTKTFGGKQFG